MLSLNLSSLFPVTSTLKSVSSSRPSMALFRFERSSKIDWARSSSWGVMPIDWEWGRGFRNRWGDLCGSWGWGEAGGNGGCEKRESFRRELWGSSSMNARTCRSLLSFCIQSSLGFPPCRSPLNNFFPCRFVFLSFWALLSPWKFWSSALEILSKSSRCRAIWAERGVELGVGVVGWEIGGRDRTAEERLLGFESNSRTFSRVGGARPWARSISSL